MRNNMSEPLDIDKIEEELKQIPIFKGYAADKNGNIWSSQSNWRGYGKRMMRPEVSKDGYLMVRLTNGTEKRLRKSVHRLVCMAFKGIPKEKQTHCRHLDGNKLNNKPENLEWGTHAENEKDTILHGKKAMGTRHGRSQLTEEEVYEIKKQIKQGKLLVNISKDFNITKGVISQIKRNKIWKHVDCSHFDTLTEKLRNEIKEKDERISALVKIAKRIKEQDKLIENFKKYQQEHWMKFMSLENKRGSDEV